MPDKYTRLILKPGKEKSLKNLHPWVFSGAVAKSEQNLPEGELAEVYSHDGKYLATGHYHNSSIMVRILTFKQQEIDASFFVKRFRQAIEYRTKLNLWNNPQTNMFRLVNGEGDNLSGLILDVYGDSAVMQVHSEGMHRSRLLLAEALNEATAKKFDTIYYKNEGKHEDVNHEKFLLGNQRDGNFHENGNTFYVNWVEGQKTGFFLDQHDNRELLSKYTGGKKILNAFCYSGGFSIYALKGKPASVHSVDSSAKACEWLKKNEQLNGLTNEHDIFQKDVFQFLAEQDAKYDLMVIDPPAFAKSLSVTEKAMMGYRNINTLAFQKLEKNSILFTFSCSQAIDRILFQKLVFQAALAAKRKVRIMHRLSQGPDHPVSIFHPEGEYLKGLVLFVE